MFNVRSRAGVVAVTAGATLLVALPVVSLGAVPAVDHLTGNANETARDVVTSAPKPSLAGELGLRGNSAHPGSALRAR
jgi:hypothetical protein